MDADVLTNTGKRHGAVLFKCSDGTGLWISHMKRTSNNSTNAMDKGQAPPFKLPAASVLPEDVVDALPCIPEPPVYVPFGERPSTFQEVLYRHAAGDVQAPYMRFVATRMMHHPKELEVQSQASVHYPRFTQMAPHLADPYSCRILQ